MLYSIAKIEALSSKTSISIAATSSRTSARRCSTSGTTTRAAPASSAAQKCRSRSRSNRSKRPRSSLRHYANDLLASPPCRVLDLRDQARVRLTTNPSRLRPRSDPETDRRQQCRRRANPCDKIFRFVGQLARRASDVVRTTAQMNPLASLAIAFSRTSEVVGEARNIRSTFRDRSCA